MRNKPRIRFKGFTEDWEQCKLSDITEIVMGQSPSSKNYTDNPNDNILVQGNADLKDGKVVPRLWTKEITKTIDKDGIILTVRAPVGDVAKTDYKVVLGRGVAGIKGNDYIYQFLQKLQNNRYWVSLSSGSTFESINSNDIKDLIIDIPSIEEQTKISMLLNNVNSIITLHQRKLEKLKLAKKALLQKLFPKNGSKFPELRFKGFADAWEQRKLGDVTNIKTGSRNQQDSVANGKYPFFIRSEKIEKLDEYDFDTEAILVPGDGRIGEIFHYYNGKFALHQRVYKVDDFKGVDAIYLLYLFQCKFKEHALRLNAQGTVPSLRLPMFTEWNIDIPSLQEQICIGRLLNKIELMITLHQRKLDKLQDVKKGLLQKMFV